MKMIMALVVVIIHTTLWPLGGLTRVAVPFFFIVSGFFLFGKLETKETDEKAVIRQWIARILKMYLIWTAIYLPFTVYGFIQDGLSVKESLLVFGRNLFFVGQNFMSWPLWYLLAMIWGGVILYILRAFKVPVWGFLLAGLLVYAVPRFLGDNPLFAKVFRNAENPVFTGPLYLAIGGALRSWRVRLPWWGAALLCVAAYVALQFTEYAVPFMAVGLFLLSVGWKATFLSDRQALALRNGSEAIYLVHMIFAGLLMILAGMDKGPLLFGLTAAASSLAAWAYYKWIKC